MKYITFPRAIRESVEAEAAAARFYARLAARTDDPRAKRFLLDMVRVEQQHGGDILVSGHSWIEWAQVDSLDQQYETIETAPGWEDVEGITLAEGLDIALECEMRASGHYRHVASLFEGSQAAFFLELAEEEDRHARMVEQAIRRRSSRFPPPVPKSA